MKCMIDLQRVSVLVLTTISWSLCAADSPADCDLTNGEKVFQKCAVCHAVEPSVAHGAGPNLHGVAGRSVGKVAGFKFSKGMRTTEVTWTDEHLDEFLADPMGTYTRTRMAFGGLKNADDRRDVICYLKEVGVTTAP